MCFALLIGTTVSYSEGVLLDLTIPTKIEAPVFLRVSTRGLWKFQVQSSLTPFNCTESPLPKATPCSAATCVGLGTDHIGYTSVSISHHDHPPCPSCHGDKMPCVCLPMDTKCSE